MDALVLQGYWHYITDLRVHQSEVSRVWWVGSDVSWLWRCISPQWRAGWHQWFFCSTDCLLWSAPVPFGFLVQTRLWWMYREQTGWLHRKYIVCWVFLMMAWKLDAHFMSCEIVDPSWLCDVRVWADEGCECGLIKPAVKHIQLVSRFMALTLRAIVFKLFSAPSLCYTDLLCQRVFGLVVWDSIPTSVGLLLLLLLLLTKTDGRCYSVSEFICL